VFGLPGPDKLALELNLPILDAEERLRTGCADDEVYSLMLAATGSEDEASAALTERVSWRLKKNQTPDV